MPEPLSTPWPKVQSTGKSTQSRIQKFSHLRSPLLMPSVNLSLRLVFGRIVFLVGLAQILKDINSWHKTHRWLGRAYLPCLLIGWHLITSRWDLNTDTTPTKGFWTEGQKRGWITTHSSRRILLAYHQWSLSLAPRPCSTTRTSQIARSLLSAKVTTRGLAWTRWPCNQAIGSR